MSGVGKTTVLNELAQRGFPCVDTDYDGWVLPDGTWDEERMATLLTSSESMIISGTVENQGKFYDRFASVVLLTAPLEVLLDRVTRRTNNPYGSKASDRAEIANYVRTVEPLLHNRATLVLDGQLPVRELADQIARLQDAVD